MFAKQATVAALILSAAGAFAADAGRNVFDTETHQRMPAAESAQGLTREAVQAAYIAQRDAKGISEFRPQSWYFAQMGDSAPAVMALVSPKADQPVAVGRTREQVRAEFLAARAAGEVNTFDTETYQRIPAARVVPTALAQK